MKQAHHGDWYHPDDKGPSPISRKLFKGGGKVKETEEEQQLALNATELLAIQQNEFDPYVDRLIADVRDNEGDRQRALGISSVESTRAFDAAADQSAAAQTNRGAGVGSGRFNMAQAGLGTAQGLSSGQNAVGVNTAISNQRLANLQSIAQVGRGEQGQALQGLSDVAGLASQRASADAQAASADSVGLASGLSTAAGYGIQSALDKKS